MKRETEVVWKDIPNYEGSYQISNDGRVLNIKTNRLLKGFPKTGGYLQVCLFNSGKRNYVFIHHFSS